MNTETRIQPGRGGRMVARMLVVAALVGLVSMSASAVSDLGRLRTIYNKELYGIILASEEYRSERHELYVLSLGKLEWRLLEKARYDKVLLVRKERARVASWRESIQPPPARDCEEISRLWESYHRQLMAMDQEQSERIVKLSDLYASHLGMLEENLTREGKIEDALSARQERKRVYRNPLVASSEFKAADIPARQ